MLEKTVGKIHPDVATVYNNIGLVYEVQGDHDKASEYTRKAQSIMRINK